MRTQRRSSFRSFVRGFIFCLIMLLVVVMCNQCSYISKPAPIELGWVGDMSNSQVNLNRDNAEQMYTHLIRNTFKIEGESDYNGAIKVYIVKMGQSMRPEIRIIYLEEGDTKLLATKKNRIAQVQAFKDELKEALEDAFSGELDQNASYLHHAICHLSRVMQRSNFSDRKSLYCFSDGLENSHLADFGSYYNRIEEFEKKFEQLSESFNKDCQLPDMYGIDFRLYNSPDASMGPIVLSAARFWQYHIEQTGASFTLGSNLSF